VLLISGGAEASERGQPADWVNVLKLVLGVLLFRLAWRQWRGRPQEGDEPELPSWMKSIDRFTAARAASFGVVLSAVNPKNLILTVSAAAAIAQTGVAAGKQAVALVVFVLVASIGTGAPVALYFALGDRSRRALDSLKEWMARNNATVLAVICVLIGAKLIGDGVSGF
jgi:threonine/homoserine/homoserine lactone efflux protein